MDLNSLTFLNQRFNNITCANISDYNTSIIDLFSHKYVFTQNKLVQDRNSSAQTDYRGADLAICDSRIAELLAGIVGKGVSVNLAADIFKDMLSSMPERPSARVVGPSPEDAVTPAAKYAAKDLYSWPGANDADRFAGLRGRGALANDLDILLLCLGFPKQEAFAASVRRKECWRGMALCVGASVDFLVGKSTSAPVFTQLARL